jgi:isoleucyl-tRNA synthetase
MVGTAGWTLDEQGRAMSKSLGNGVDPVDIADRLGAEIVRLWVASVDFREDVVSSEAIMLRLAENYRKLRNTFRFLLGNLAGFDPVSDAVSDAELLPLDRYMLARCRELVEKVCGADGKGGWYCDLQFHRVYHAINEFCIVDLSSFYLDVLKDRLYTFAPKGVERRSAQTVLWRIAEALVRLVAPILTFTSDEVWQYLPAASDKPGSVHLAVFPKAEEICSVPQLIDEWKVLSGLREVLLRSLEELRQSKEIGKALEAEVEFYAAEPIAEILHKNVGSLKELFNVSHVHLHKVLDPASAEPRDPSKNTHVVTGIANLKAFVRRASGHKCDRCWNYYPDDSPQHVRQFGAWPNVCGRCADALRQMGYSEDPQ